MIRAITFVVFGGGLLPASLSAAVLLLVDISDPSAVVITSTTANSENEFLPPDAGTGSSGVTLKNLLVGNTLGTLLSATSGSIGALRDETGTLRLDLTNAWIDDYTGGYTKADFDIQIGDSTTLRFETDERALTGSAVFDITSILAIYYPAVGESGNILVGNPDDNKVIGQWLVVPEPSTTLIGLLAALALLRRSRA